MPSLAPGAEEGEGGQQHDRTEDGTAREAERRPERKNGSAPAAHLGAAVMTPPFRSRSSAPVVVTTARLSHTDDIALREKRYAITQGIRLICVILGVALPVPVPVKLLFFLGAVCLPWFGVVMANAGPTVSRKRQTAIVEGRLGETLPYGGEEQPLRLAIEPGRVVDAER